MRCIDKSLNQVELSSKVALALIITKKTKRQSKMIAAIMLNHNLRHVANHLQVARKEHLARVKLMILWGRIYLSFIDAILNTNKKKKFQRSSCRYTNTLQKNKLVYKEEEWEIYLK